MVLNNTSQKPIESLCDKILSGDSFIKIINEKFNADRNFLEDNYKGHITEEKFKRIISMSIKNTRLRQLLPSIVDCVSDDSITEDIFDMLYMYQHRRTREDFIISLCHKKLPINMLRILCRTNLCFECYFELAIRIYQSDEFTADDFKTVLHLFFESPYSAMEEELICEIKSYNASSYDKQVIIDDFQSSND